MCVCVCVCVCVYICICLVGTAFITFDNNPSNHFVQHGNSIRLLHRAGYCTKILLNLSNNYLSLLSPISADLNFQQLCCRNLKPRVVSVIFMMNR